MDDLTSKEDWENVESEGWVTDLPIKKILRKYLTKTRGKAIEIGCVPGKFLSYICREFGYFPEGIDYLKNAEKITGQTLINNGLKEFNIYQADFRTWKSEKKYDLVCSFGFIEHFSNPEEILEKHVALMKKGGKLVVEVPNFGGFKGWLQRNFDPESYYKHNPRVMNIDFFRKFAEKSHLIIKYLGYSDGFKIWWTNRNPTVYQKAIHHFFKIISLATQNVEMNNKLSTFIVFVAEK